jgi:hypothetical protein
MTVHHATVKRAAQQGFLIQDSNELEDAFELLIQNGGEGTDAALAKHAADFRLSGDDAKVLVDAIPAIRLALIEHGMTLTQPEDFGVQIEIGEWVYDKSFEIEDLEAGIEEAARAAEEAGVEAPEDDEEEDRASVVPHTYKRRYAEAGHPNTCGDWLASQLNGECLGEDGFNLDLFEAICDANGVDIAPYTRRKTRGWQGRARMTGRNKLATAVVKANGVLHIPAMNGHDDQELHAPADWLASKAPRAKGKAAVEA